MARPTCQTRPKTLPGRLELPTLRLTASRSNQLSYGSLREKTAWILQIIDGKISCRFPNRHGCMYDHVCRCIGCCLRTPAATMGDVTHRVHWNTNRMLRMVKFYGLYHTWHRLMSSRDAVGAECRVGSSFSWMCRFCLGVGGACAICDVCCVCV